MLRFQTKEDTERLIEAVRLASYLGRVDTSGVEPLVYILGDKTTCPVREDVPKLQPDTKKKLLNLATVVEEDYYVAPGK